MDTASPEFQAALRDHAKSLGVDPDAESHLLSFVQEALLAELPDGWEQGETEDGTLYYFNTNTDESIWEHPLDAHYRELVKQRQAEGPPPTADAKPAEVAAPVPAKTTSDEPSKLEVYSFDDDSDDDAVKPVSKPSASDRGSRLSSLFSTPEPAPSFSATSATMATKEAATSRTSSRDTSRGSAPVTTSTTPIAGFGRDRSWLLDNDDDDDIPTIPLTRPTTATSTSASQSTEIKDLMSSRPSTASSTTAVSTSNNSSLSYTARLFGGAAATSLSSSTSGPVSAMATTVSAIESLNETSKISPRRGIASTIKGPFFQEMAAAETAPSAVPAAFGSAVASSNAADVAKIKDLEKKNAELVKQLEQLKGDSESTKQQLETARQKAKEASYLKMKANETKAKLSEKETELAKAKQDNAKLQDDAQRLHDECSSLKQIQKTATQQEILDAKKVASELQVQLNASAKRASEAEQTLQQSRHDCERLDALLKDATADLERVKKELIAKVEAERKELVANAERDAKQLAGDLERERRNNGVLKEQWEREQSESRLVREQLNKLKHDFSDQSRKFESVALVQDALDRQAKFVKELEEKLKDVTAKCSDVEAKEAQATRETKLKELEVQDLNHQLVNLAQDLATRDKRILELQDMLRLEQQHASEVHGKALSMQRTEEEFERKRQLLEREKQELGAQLRDRSDQLQSLQSQLQRAQEEQVGGMAKLQMELTSLHSQLKHVKSQEVLPLEKQRDQLVHEADRVREKLASVEKELRSLQQELATESSKTHQLQVEIEAWKRKEQQQKTQKEGYLHEKMSVEKQLQSLHAEASAYKHDKRLELEKMAFRLRDLESQVAQKDYEIVRVEEKFTKAEAWRLKEARRVEERESQLLDLKEELAQTKSRNIEAENNLIVHELRREKEQLSATLKSLAQQLEEERTARQVAAQKFQDEAENLQKAVEWQLPQLAAACVSRSSEEWTRKCNEIVKALRDDWNMKALAERNELVQRLKDVDERRDHVEQKLKNAVSECEFLRKEVHRVEDNNKVLLDQLHTIRVYMTQRAGVSAFATSPAQAPQAPPAPPMSHPPTVSVHTAPSAPLYSDFAAVNQLNTQLAVLHAQFQQLFDAHAEPTRHHVREFSPSDRFEIPSSPPPQPRRRPHKDEMHTSSLSTVATSLSSSSSSSPLDQTLDSLLHDRKSAASVTDPHREKQELLATLESIGGTSLPASPVASVVRLDGSDSAWYQQNYWRTKYQQQ